MQTVPTDFIDGPDSEENEEKEEIWGRMFPLGSSFIAVGNCMKSHSCCKSATVHDDATTILFTPVTFPSKIQWRS